MYSNAQLAGGPFMYSSTQQLSTQRTSARLATSSYKVTFSIQSSELHFRVVYTSGKEHKGTLERNPDLLTKLPPGEHFSAITDIKPRAVCIQKSIFSGTLGRVA